MFARFYRHNLFMRTDLIWFRRITEGVLDRHGERMRIDKSAHRQVCGSASLRRGKYNAGQKVLFRLIIASISVLLASGLTMWRAYSRLLPDSRGAALHPRPRLARQGLILGHPYLTIWGRGSIIGMATGHVSPAWARQHHDRWYEELKARERPAPLGRLRA
ncbi:hypothetical protein V5F53_02240 [Xanthobacter sp. V4C-4]|uniref:hypothetical protein n=1 Tax=Xanthobacter cornucopiae TaxID=3119924 RepID=UPI00372C0FF5